MWEKLAYYSNAFRGIVHGENKELQIWNTGSNDDAIPSYRSNGFDNYFFFARRWNSEIASNCIGQISWSFQTFSGVQRFPKATQIDIIVSYSHNVPLQAPSSHRISWQRPRTSMSSTRGTSASFLCHILIYLYQLSQSICIKEVSY